MQLRVRMEVCRDPYKTFTARQAGVDGPIILIRGTKQWDDREISIVEFAINEKTGLSLIQQRNQLAALTLLRELQDRRETISLVSLAELAQQLHDGTLPDDEE